jgi:hypothetical protein
MNKTDSRKVRGASFRPEGPPTQRPNDCTDCIGQPILPARLAEWHKELVHFIRKAVDLGRHARQQDCLPSDSRPRCPAKFTVAEEGQVNTYA